MLIFIKVF